MDAPLAEQAATMTQWGLPPAGLLILMSPCEGRCFFCAQPAVTHPPEHDWTQWERVNGLLDANHAEGLQRLCIGCTEPTTHPDFIRALDLAGATGFESIELMTSALKLATPGTAEKWAAAGIRTIATPIYSADPDIHNSVVGTPCHSTLVSGLDAAQAAGIEVRLHTLALRRTLPGLGALAAMSLQRWQTPLTLAPARPKDGVWSYTSQAPSLAEVTATVQTVSTGAVQLTGWPDCVLPDRPRGAAQVIELYFRGQARAYAPACTDCALRSGCPGLVSALLDRDGPDGLRPR